MVFVAAQMGSVRIYLSNGTISITYRFAHWFMSVTEIPTSQAKTFMEAKQTAIARFIHVMSPLANIYQLPLTSLHIFYDLQGGLIAFNRNGSIFLNLRYFEQWRKHSLLRNSACLTLLSDDASVSRGNSQSAYISWYT